MQLSKNFYLSEFLSSQTAHRHNIKEQFSPPENIIRNLEALCINILQPVRDKFGSIRISSGYRCKKLNDIVKGSPTSQHMTGQAADIQGIRASNKALFDFIKSSGLPYDQLIWEYGTSACPAWVHVSFRSDGKNRKQILYIGVI
jgi:hypothetical protein